MIVYRSDDWLVVDKPAGWLTVPGRRPDDARPVLRAHLERDGPALPCHRLDAHVSGLILFARTRAAHRLANRAFEARQVQKTYEAWTHLGPLAAGLHEWTAPLARGKKRTFVADHGKPSRTAATLRSVETDHARWSLRPHTGRTHQLRVHAAHAGHPILGDVLYGSDIAWQSGIALRAVRLELELPGLPPVLAVEGLVDSRA